MIKHPDGRIEGTAAEIAEYERMRAEREKVEKGPFDKTPWWPDNIIPKTTNNCPNAGKPCYCTGACMGHDNTNGPYYAKHLKTE